MKARRIGMLNVIVMACLSGAPRAATAMDFFSLGRTPILVGRGPIVDGDVKAQLEPTDGRVLECARIVHQPLFLKIIILEHGLKSANWRKCGIELPGVVGRVTSNIRLH